MAYWLCQSIQQLPIFRVLYIGWNFEFWNFGRGYPTFNRRRRKPWTRWAWGIRNIRASCWASHLWSSQPPNSFNQHHYNRLCYWEFAIIFSFLIGIRYISISFSISNVYAVVDRCRVVLSWILQLPMDYSALVWGRYRFLSFVEGGLYSRLVLEVFRAWWGWKDQFWG